MYKWVHALTSQKANMFSFAIPNFVTSTCDEEDIIIIYKINVHVLRIFCKVKPLSSLHAHRLLTVHYTGPTSFVESATKCLETAESWQQEFTSITCITYKTNSLHTSLAFSSSQFLADLAFVMVSRVVKV